VTGLPRLLVLTDRTQCAGPLIDTVAAAVDAGARAVVLREKDLPEARRNELAVQLSAVLAPVDGLLVRAGPGPATAVHLTAMHLAAADPFPVPRPALVGRSCHSAAELDRSAAEGCDWVLLSPFAATPSKPGYGPALGAAGLAALLAGRRPPRSYALGGVQPADVAACLAAGAWGVAVMGPVMRDPGRVAAYLAALPG
jgi:thiamine monophosphate synthase